MRIRPNRCILWPTYSAALQLLSCPAPVGHHSCVMSGSDRESRPLSSVASLRSGFSFQAQKNAPGPKTHPLRCAFGNRETSIERTLAAIFAATGFWGVVWSCRGWLSGVSGRFSAATGLPRSSESCRGSIITRWPLFPAATGLQRTQESCRGNLDGTHPLTYSYRQFSFRCRPQNAFIAIYTHSVSTNQFISPSIWP